MAKIIQHQIFFPNPPEQVWDYITKPELMAQWLMPGNLQPIVGHEFQLNAPAMPDMDFDGTFYCKVLEVVPFKKLSYSWHFGPGNGSLNKSVVHWSLTAKDNGTDFLLVHRDFEGTNFLAMFTSMNEGWKKHITKILSLLNPETDGTTQA